MSQRTCHLTALVVRGTKLGEMDRIVTLVAEDGSQWRAVAKGARKPGSRFGASLEVGSCARMLVTRGRSLDIVTEARSAKDLKAAHADLEHEAGLAVMCDLLSHVTVPGQPLPRAFDLSVTAIGALGAAEVARVPLLTAAHALKLVSIAGFRPSLGACALCGRPLASPASARVPFSFAEGGRLCGPCASHADVRWLPAQVVALAGICIKSTFAQLMAGEADPDAGLSLLRVVQDWALAHLDLNMRSLSFMLSSGLYRTAAPSGAALS